MYSGYEDEPLDSQGLVSEPKIKWLKANLSRGFTENYSWSLSKSAKVRLIRIVQNKISLKQYLNNTKLLKK